MNRFLLAVRFLTVFPVGGAPEGPPAREDLSAAMAFFPLAGLLQGIVALIVYAVLEGPLPDAVASALVIAVLTLTNGGFHLDGFADTVDGLAGGATPDERLRIMRDHTTGAVGVVFLIIVILLKFVSLDAVSGEAKAGAIVAFPVMGRWSMTVLSYLSEYARKTGGLGEAFSSIPRQTLAVSTVITAIISIVFLGAPSVLVLIMVALLAWALSIFFRRRLGGVTGDVFGFQNELGEVLSLLGILLVC